MKCPKCGKQIDEVFIVSEYTQRGILNGKRIESYEELSHTGGVGKTLRCECPECDEDITKFVKE